MIALSAGEVTQPARVLHEVKLHGGYFGPMLGLKGRNGIQARQYLSGQRGERDTGASGTHRPFQTRDERADGDHRGRVDHEDAHGRGLCRCDTPLATNVPAILGTETQTGSHVQALRHVCDFTEVRVWSHTRDRAKAFAKEHGCTEDAVRAAVVVVTATSSQTSVLQGVWLKERAHVNVVGAPIAT